MVEIRPSKIHVGINIIPTLQHYALCGCAYAGEVCWRAISSLDHVLRVKSGILARGASPTWTSGMGDRALVPSQNLTFLTLMVVYLTKPNGLVVVFGGIMGDIANERVIVSIFVDWVNQPQAVAAQVEVAADCGVYKFVQWRLYHYLRTRWSRFDGRCLGKLVLHIADPLCLENFNENNKLRNSISDMLRGALSRREG